LRAQLRALLEERRALTPRLTATVSPQIREAVIPPPPPLVANHRPQNNSIFLIDLTDEDETDNVNHVVNDESLLNDSQDSEDDIIFLNAVPSANEVLEPLDPDIEFHHNISQLFIDLEAYARNIFEGIEQN